MKNRYFLLIIVTLALIITLISIYYQRPSSELVEFGNMCDVRSWMDCYRPRVSAGFPFAFVFDTPGVSVQYKIFLEDDFRLYPFIINIWFYTTLLLFTYKSIKK